MFDYFIANGCTYVCCSRETAQRDDTGMLRFPANAASRLLTLRANAVSGHRHNGKKARAGVSYSLCR